MIDGSPFRTTRLFFARSVMLAGLCLVATGCCSFRCKPAFDNFGPGQTYQLAGNEAVQGSATAGGYNASANAFVPTRSGRLCRVFIATGLKGGPNAFDLRLMTDGGKGPGSVLEEWHLRNRMPPFGTQSAPVKVCSTKHPRLEAGKSYWLAALPDTNDTSAGWNETAVGPNGPIAFSVNGTTWLAPTSGEPGAFRIDVR